MDEKEGREKQSNSDGWWWVGGYGLVKRKEVGYR